MLPIAQLRNKMHMKAQVSPPSTYVKGPKRNVHLVIYSNNEPFNTTKRITIESVKNFSDNNIVIHDYNFEKIKAMDWFKEIASLPEIHTDSPTFYSGRRDGYYNSWKAFIIKDVYDTMQDDDILYYVDSSQHFRTGFTENIDRLCEIAYDKHFIAGSIGSDSRNNEYRVCDNLSVWDKIYPNNDNRKYLTKMHVLNAWFILRKNKTNTSFINEWAYFTSYKDNELIHPLVTYHHTGDQSIFNILVLKYKYLVFHRKDIIHCDNKNKNLVLEVVNNNENTDDLFIHL